MAQQPLARSRPEPMQNQPYGDVSRHISVATWPCRDVHDGARDPLGRLDGLHGMRPATNDVGILLKMWRIDGVGEHRAHMDARQIGHLPGGQLVRSRRTRASGGARPARPQRVRHDSAAPNARPPQAGHNRRGPAVQRSHVRNQRVVDRTRIRVLKCGHPIAIHGGSFLAGADDGRSNLRRRQEGIRVRLAQRGQPWPGLRPRPDPGRWPRRRRGHRARAVAPVVERAGEDDADHVGAADARGRAQQRIDRRPEPEAPTTTTRSAVMRPLAPATPR
jgi:hypothetical protein